MTDKTSVHSNAFNFMSFINTGVDPRTGQYTVSIDLPELKSNRLAGPGFAAKLFYSPLNTEDSGYGKGWTLKLTQYTPGNQVLSVSSGDAFKVTGADGNRLVLGEQKIVAFHFYRETSGDDRFMRVVHRSGLVERLEMMGSGEHRIALPVEIFSPEGRRITLRYRTFRNDWVLDSIIDDEGQTLFKTERNAQSVELIEYPYAASGASARYVLTLSGSDSRVVSLALPTENKASWRFDYQDVRGYLCIIRVMTPVGGVEHVEYRDGGHEFPAAAQRPALPRVTRHLSVPGFGQAQVDLRYTYTQPSNFIGGGTSIVWADNGLDNLYKVEGTYHYGSDETLMVDDQAVRTTTRTFNRFHLLVEQSTQQGDSVNSQYTEYPLVEGPFERQLPYCQLPVKETTRWWMRDGSGRLRDQVVSSTYDNHGNVLTRKDFTGQVQVNTWYDAAGEDGCPADPEGFVRHLKTQTQEPSAEGVPGAPVLRKRYRYITLEALPGNGLSPVHVQESEALVAVVGATERLLELTEQTYCDDTDDRLRYGRTESSTLSYPAPAGSDAPRGLLSTTTVHDYDSSIGLLEADEVLHEVQTVTGFDGESKVVTLEYSQLTGEPVLTHDDNEVRIRYEYDELRRVTRETVAPGTPFEASRNYQYFLCAYEREQAWQSMDDVKGVTTLTRFDGLHRAIEELRDDVDDARVMGERRPIYRARYDALGQLVSETEIDWMSEDDLELTSTFEYDDWGEQCCVTGPDGVRNHDCTDPIGTVASRGPVQTSWREGSGVSSGRQVTWLNLFEQPTRIERFDREARLVSRQQNAYDGLGRLIAESNGSGNSPRVTQYVYDAFGRALDTTLPGGAIVHRRYAPHSRDDLPTQIWVNDGTLLGEQGFDGLGRRVSATTGGRVQLFLYNPGERKPRLMIAPNGREVRYEYNPMLGEEPIRREFDDGEANFQFDPQNARLMSCDATDYKVERTYFSFGEVKDEWRTVDGETERFHMSYDYSYRKRVRTYVDVLGQAQLYRYDNAGRLVETSLGKPLSVAGKALAAYEIEHANTQLDTSLRSTFSYDALGRTHSILTEDLATQNRLTTRLEYDDFDREILRVFEFGEGTPSQSLEQVYDEFDCLSRRVLRQGTDILRDESYQYDGRGRLIRYDCAGSECPTDPYGNVITQQIFTFDAQDNIILVMTTGSKGVNRARYFFENPADPVQLSRITNTLTAEGYPAQIHLSYDENGNLTEDDAGRTLRYDSLNRLLSVSGENGNGTYRYDPQDILASTSSDA